MIGGIDTTSIRLASAYNANNQLLADTLTRIASGKKISRPSDDFTGYLRSNRLQNDVDSYTKIKENLTSAKAVTGTAVEVGNSIYEDLVKMKDLLTSYYNTADSADDNEERSAIQTEFNAVKNNLTSYISNTKYSGTTVYSAATLETVSLDPDGTGQLAITFAAGDIAVPATPTLTGFVVGDAATTATNQTSELAALNTQITAATSYLVKAQSYDKSVDRQLRVSDTIIQSKQSAISLITDIDEVSEMNKQTDLMIRQQASISMLAQAQLSRSAITRLFD
jgi:flagellin